jgi:hypothetical protein
MFPTPPLGDPTPARTCLRDMLDGSLCGADAPWHVIWDAALEGSLACDAHLAEAKTRWVYFTVHARSPACGELGSVFIHSEDVCVFPDDREPGTLVVCASLAEVEAFDEAQRKVQV